MPSAPLTLSANAVSAPGVPAGVTVSLKIRSSPVFAIKRLVLSALNARPFAPNGGKAWSPGRNSGSVNHGETAPPVGRAILKILPPNEAETKRVPEPSKSKALSPQPAPAPPQTGMGGPEGVLEAENGGKNSTALPFPKSVTHSAPSEPMIMPSGEKLMLMLNFSFPFGPKAWILFGLGGNSNVAA